MNMLIVKESLYLLKVFKRHLCSFFDLLLGKEEKREIALVTLRKTKYLNNQLKQLKIS